MSYGPTFSQSFGEHPPPPSQAPAATYYQSAPGLPPSPPPKTSGSSTPNRGPPLPPPPPGLQQNEPLELEAGTLASTIYSGQQQQQQQYHAPSEPHIPAVEPNWLPDILRDKTTSDLAALLQDQTLLSALLSNPSTTHPSVLASEAALKPLLEGNISLAREVQAAEAQLRQQREAAQSRLLALRALEQQHRSRIADAELALRQFSPMALYQQLSASVLEQERLVRGIEESWLDGADGTNDVSVGGGGGGVVSERELNDFVRRVREARKVEFLRRERKQRWDEGRVGGWR